MATIRFRWFGGNGILLLLPGYTASFRASVGQSQFLVRSPSGPTEGRKTKLLEKFAVLLKFIFGIESACIVDMCFTVSRLLWDVLVDHVPEGPVPVYYDIGGCFYL